MDSIKYIDLINLKYGWTDYKTCKKLGLKKGSISPHRRGITRSFSTNTALRIAYLLEIDAMGVVADMYANAAKTKREADFWNCYKVEREPDYLKPIKTDRQDEERVSLTKQKKRKQSSSNTHA